MLFEGAVLFGDRTMVNNASAYANMNIRWLFATVEKTVAITSRTFLFETNTDFLRSRVVHTIAPLLNSIKGEGGLDDFAVICDDSNNDGASIARNELHIKVLIKPVYSTNFIEINFTAVDGLLSFEEVLNG